MGKKVLNTLLASVILLSVSSCGYKQSRTNLIQTRNFISSNTNTNMNKQYEVDGKNVSVNLRSDGCGFFPILLIFSCSKYFEYNFEHEPDKKYRVVLDGEKINVYRDDLDENPKNDLDANHELDYNYISDFSYKVLRGLRK